MAKPTILIGIGTSGLRVIEEVQQFSYENSGQNKYDHVEYLYLETDENSYPDITALPNEIKRLHISLSDKEVMINSLRKDKHLDTEWLPPPEQIIESEFGAGGLPAFGRVALWGKDNFDNVSSAIKLAYSRVGNYTVEDGDDSQPAVFITGSLTGGTGSGIFIDMAYMVRHLIDQVSEVYGLFMIPGKGKFSGHEILYCNTYGSLKSLDYFNDIAQPYTMRWPNGHMVDFKVPPFELTQFISQDYTGPIPSIANLTGLYKMGGLYLYLNLMGLREKRLKRLGDAFGNLQIGKYGTFGLAAIQYPKAQLEEYLAIRQSVELLNRWVDAEVYYEHGTKIPLKSARPKIYNRELKNFGEHLREAFNLLDALNIKEGQSLKDDLTLQARVVARKEYTTNTPQIHLFELFSPSKTGNYYDAVKNSLKTAEDSIIRQISSTISESIDRYENLHVAILQLESITEAIQQTIQFWKKLGVSGQPPKWEQQLRKLVTWMMKNQHGWLGQKEKVLADRLYTTLECMKMHLLANRLVDIRNNILKGDLPITTLSDNLELPRIKSIRKTIGMIRKVTGADRPDKGESWGRTLLDRQAEIEADIKDTTIPILRVFPSGSFDEQVKRALNAHVKNTGNSIPSKTTLISKDNLWEHLKSSDRVRRKLYSETIGGFIQELQDFNTVPEMDVSDHIAQKPEEAKKIAERATAPLLKINNDRQTMFTEDAAYLPKLIMASDHSSVNKTLQTFFDLNFTKFNDSEDGIYIKEELRNIMVFYTEFGAMHDRTTFDPIKHLQYIPEIRNLYKEYPEHRDLTPEEWHILRVPYLPFQGNSQPSSEGENAVPSSDSKGDDSSSNPPS